VAAHILRQNITRTNLDNRRHKARHMVVVLLIVTLRGLL
jgi:hypothetical protein